MLYNPNQGKTAKDISLADFIGWLETKDPTETYNYQDRTGKCCLGQYMAARGVAWDYDRNYSDISKKAGEAHTLRERSDFQHVLAGPRCGTSKDIILSTFGETLTRAKAYQKRKENA